MKLKRLEISGFKSFFEKAVIEFPHGITAVVGPNGCGKSNVIDAIRWVMGEQSVKQLRGKSMEDVIFSGTNGKAPLGMAEVSLTLANDNGGGPAELKDFTEINLTRRLYRSGESAYLLNKQPCRLKDIHNVFLGSGMGSKSYAFIQQGNIGIITEAGPEERRYFIEEAAGVTRYKHHKTEALRKIDTTQQNLLRVADIILEIKRQMDSLKRQARKAELFSKYQRRARELDVRLASHQVDDLTLRIEETQRLLQSLRDADVEHTTELQQLDAAVEEIKLDRWQKNQAISDRKTEKHNLQRSVDRMEKDIEHLRGEIDRLSREAGELQNPRRGLEEQNSGMLAEIVQGETENNRLRGEIEKARGGLEQERAALEAMNARLAGMNHELETARTGLVDLTAR
ncbi:MAG: AAA family ATPase, partial [Desulfobacterales bacterium]